MTIKEWHPNKYLAAEALIFTHQEPMETIYKPDGLIYFTDGHANTPKILLRCPTLRVISADGIKEEDKTWGTLPGKVLKLKF